MTPLPVFPHRVQGGEFSVWSFEHVWACLSHLHRHKLGSTDWSILSAHDAALQSRAPYRSIIIIRRLFLMNKNEFKKQ
jgi:hypothetical protein